jgi:hypothetical protein
MCQGTIADWTILFSAPSIVRLDLQFSPTVAGQQVTPTGIFYQMLYDALRTRFTLRYLTIYIGGGFSFARHPDLMHLLQCFLSQAKQLTKLHILNGATLYTTLLPRLSLLPALQSLQLGSAASPLDKDGTKPWTNPNPFSETTFANLKRLVITCTFSLAMNILNLVNSPLETLSLHVPPSVYQYDMTSWFMAARGKFKASLRSFTFSHDMRWEPAHWSGKHLVAFVSGLQLRALEVDLSGGLLLDDNIVRDLGASCPTLRSIKLGHLRSRLEPLQVTWRGVLELVRPHLLILRVGHSPIENARNIATLFYRVFPSLEYFEYGIEKWREVSKELSDMRAVGETGVLGRLQKDPSVGANVEWPVLHEVP